MKAYNEFALWVDAVIHEGKLISLRDLTNKPLTRCSELVLIVNRLRISYLVVGFGGEFRLC